MACVEKSHRRLSTRGLVFPVKHDRCADFWRFASPSIRSSSKGWLQKVLKLLRGGQASRILTLVLIGLYDFFLFDYLQGILRREAILKATRCIWHSMNPWFRSNGKMDEASKAAGFLATFLDSLLGRCSSPAWTTDPVIGEHSNPV